MSCQLPVASRRLLHLRPGLCPAIALILLTSCSFLGKTKDTFFSLSPLPGTVRNVTGTPIGIDGIELPPGIDRREIVLRKTDGQLDVRGTELWAGPLGEMVLHTLAFDLAKRLPEGMMTLPGAATPSAMRPVRIVFEDLAAGADGQFVLDARWTLGGITNHERITVNAKSGTSADIVAAMNEALSTLADRIVAKL